MRPAAPPAPPLADRDPLWWCAAIAAAFLALVWHRLGIPSKIYFDEVHYVPAARKLLALTTNNPEHPLLGKEAIAAAIWLLGDYPLAWRVPSALLGALGLFAFGRALWFASGRRFATLAGMLLLATDFAWFIQSRIAMLDMVMASAGMIAIWMFAAAIRKPEQGRWCLVLCGVFVGLAISAKWSIVPAAMLPGLTFLALKLKDCRGRFLTAREGGPVPGISLIEAALWLGALPLALYWLTFLPAFFYPSGGPSPWHPVAWHKYMLQLQDSVTRLHPYRSVWYEWAGNWRAIWYLYEVTDGAQRGVVLVGNPFTMLAGLAALLWALCAVIWRRRWDAGAFALLYAVSLGMWAVSGKPIQFYYHYLLPGTFLMAVLALALDALWRVRPRWRWIKGVRWLAPLALLASAAMFGWFYPIISGAKLHHGRPSFEEWMWLKSWR